MKPFSDATTGDHMWSTIFSDCIKDALGNVKVTDCNDAYSSVSGTYTSAGTWIIGSYLHATESFGPTLMNSISRGFSGSMGDDYVTGTLLTVYTKNPSSNIFGNRGKFFSKFHASEILPLTLSPDDVKADSSLSSRLVPWNEKMSRTAFRFTQHFDGNERYYDSCLPDIGKCFEANGCTPWVPNADPVTQLSPHGNIHFTSGNVLLFFNGYEMDRKALGFTKDPLVNNEWSWSYPYERKYAPELRSINNSVNLNLPVTNLSADWGLGITDSDWAMKVGDIKRLQSSIFPTGLIPILPGYIEGIETLDSVTVGSTNITPRNSFRKPYGSSLLEWGNTAVYADITKDSTFGLSNIIPTDVNLSMRSSQQLNNGEFFTGSMLQNDMIKFLFGFGDLNNMAHGYMKVDASSYTSYVEPFERLDRDQASSIPPYNPTSGDLIINWVNSPTVNGWNITEAEGYQDCFNGNSYNYYNQNNGPPSQFDELETTGFLWKSSSTSNAFILKSDTITDYQNGTMDPGMMGTSICSVDITSSFPWSVRYMRGIVAPSRTNQIDSGLLVYFSGTPNLSSADLPDGPFQVIAPLEFLTGSEDSYLNSRYTIMSEFDSILVTKEGVQDRFFSPGAWRLNFAYTRGPIIQSTGSELGQIEYGAAIDDLEIRVFDTLQLDVNGPKLGCNNYPHFRKYKIDPRNNTTYSDPRYTQINRDISKELYRGYLAGISPIIRGWKYGLYSGFPSNSRSTWKRNAYGQFRDMLEQRSYTKFISTDASCFDGEAIVISGASKSNVATKLCDSPVNVNFVSQSYKADERGIGYIFNTKVDASSTQSYNLSSEATSSFPYKEGNSYFAAPQAYEAGVRSSHRAAPLQRVAAPPLDFSFTHPQKIEVKFGSISTRSTTDKS